MRSRHVVVMGGSVAGCLAAAAAARSGARVTVLERDPDPEGPRPRRGVAQGHQVHVLLDGGRQAIEALLPGFSQDLRERGALVIDTGRDVRWFHGGVWKMRPEVGRPVYTQSRPFLEWRIREHVRGLDQVVMRFDTAVDAPVHEDGVVRGVRLADGEVLEADLVIDATGRGTRLPRFLESWGYGVVPERRVHLDLTYVSCYVRAPSKDLLDDFLIIYSTPPHIKRSGLAQRIEDDRCVITLQGYHGEKPPTDPDDYVAYAKGLERPELWQLLRSSEAPSALHKFTFPFQLRRSYAALSRFPRGILPVGDAITSLDPVFGQGMSVAAQEAMVLREHLQRDGASPADYLRAVDRLLDPIWFLTTVEGNRWREARGERPFGTWAIHRILDRFYQRCADDETIVRAFYDIMHLVRPPTVLARPDLAVRLLGSKRGSTRLATPIARESETAH